MTEKSENHAISMRAFYKKYESAVVCIITRDANGDQATGTGFHIGDGYIATARHVIESGDFSIKGRYCSAVELKVEQTYLPNDDNVDLALLRADCPPSLTHVDISLDFGGLEDTYHLTHCLLMGYPRIPLSTEPVLVAVQAEVNAVIKKYLGCQHEHLIISSVPRGGFSGGPVINQNGSLIGMMIESLVTDNRDAEVGFTSAISTEPLWELLSVNNIYPGDNGDILFHLEQNFVNNGDYE